MRSLVLFSVLFLSIAGKAFCQPGISLMPKIIEKGGRHALLVDGKPFLVLGGQAHNSSAWPGMMPRVWKAVAAMHANTLEVPIYWEQIEAKQGVFDFSLIDTLLRQSQQH